MFNPPPPLFRRQIASFCRIAAVAKCGSALLCAIKRSQSKQSNVLCTNAAIIASVFRPGARTQQLKTFTEFEKEITPEIICRVHKSYMVAMAKIGTVEKDQVKVGQFVIPISDTYRKAFFELLNTKGKY